jgi:restriction system protein
MTVPTYDQFMLPLLEALADGADHRLRDLVPVLADRLGLGAEERTQFLPSGQQTILANRVGWAKTYLKKAGLISNPPRGPVRLTEEGRAVLARKPPRIDDQFLAHYPGFTEFKRGTSAKVAASAPANEPATPAATPEESLESGYRGLRAALADDLLERIMSCPPTFFERLVIDLLLAMGYGGSRSDAGRPIGRPGDEGIDGLIKEDKLGLDVIYVQAKRWSGTVGRPDVQRFAGALAAHNARKGVLITTSKFSKECYEYVGKISYKIVLIDGPRLAELLIDHDVGVAAARTYVVKKIDLDYFEEGED